MSKIIPQCNPEARVFNNDILKTLESEGVDPIRIMAQVAAGTLIDPTTGEPQPLEAKERLAAAKELAQYIHPKKRTLDVNKEIKASVQFQVVKFADVMPDEAARLQEQIKEKHGNRMSQQLTAATAKRLMQDVRHIDPVTIEAMRQDIEATIVDEHGIIIDEY